MNRIPLTFHGVRFPVTPIPLTRGPSGPSPLRPSRSIRRSASVDMSWPGGLGTQLRLEGRARDAITDLSSEPPTQVDSATTSVGIGPSRNIQDIACTPERANIEALIGSRGGGNLRSVLDQVLPGERESGSPLHLLLDDISGTSLIAGFAWSRWQPQRMESGLGQGGLSSMEGVCIGFRPGSSALHNDTRPGGNGRAQRVVSLVNPADPAGWHALPEQPKMSMRRARRIDVWIDAARDGEIVIDSAFQDRCGDPDLGRIAVHEYLLQATIDSASMTVSSITPDPRILPFEECPSAVLTAQAIVGASVAKLRFTVLELLAKTNGCTHLNDAMRALADVPVLIAHLQRAFG